jgi:hypothetical protein
MVLALGLRTPSQSPLCRPLVLALSRVPAQDTHLHYFIPFPCHGHLWPSVHATVEDSIAVRRWEVFTKREWSWCSPAALGPPQFQMARGQYLNFSDGYQLHWQPILPTSALRNPNTVA